MEQEQSPDEDALGQAKIRTAALYERLRQRSAELNGPNPIRRAINEAIQRARPPETTVELPDDEQ